MNTMSGSVALNSTILISSFTFFVVYEGSSAHSTREDNSSIIIRKNLGVGQQNTKMCSLPNFPECVVDLTPWSDRHNQSLLVLCTMYMYMIVITLARKKSNPHQLLLLIV